MTPIIRSSKPGKTLKSISRGLMLLKQSEMQKSTPRTPIFPLKLTWLIFTSHSVKRQLSNILCVRQSKDHTSKLSRKIAKLTNLGRTQSICSKWRIVQKHSQFVSALTHFRFTTQRLVRKSMDRITNCTTWVAIRQAWVNRRNQYNHQI